MPGRILIVDDEAAMRRMLGRQLRSLGHHTTVADSGEAALGIIDNEPLDVVLADIRMPGMTGDVLCREVLGRAPDLPVILMTGFGTVDAAVDAIRAGAWDFLRKPFEVEELEVAVERALRHQRLRSELGRLRERACATTPFAGLLGASPPMQRLFSLVERVGRTTTTVLLHGESGTGKERVARALHQLSPRSQGPWVPVNCAAISEHLMEAELFGHTRGAFTGAERDRPGLFRAADKGTLFLDEVAELSPAAQARLLRVLEERAVRPLGEHRAVPVDVRLVAATHADLAAEVAAGRFREDLFYRLKVVTLVVPPLRERGEDVLLLGDHFVQEQAAAQGRALTWGDDFEDALMAWHWPGNVRELRNTIEAAATLSADGRLAPEMVPGGAAAGAPAAHRPPEQRFPTLDQVERRHVQRVLGAVDGNRSQAARILGIDRKTLRARLRRWEEAGS